MNNGLSCACLEYYVQSFLPVCVSCGLLWHVLVVEGLSSCEVLCNLISSGVVTYRAVRKWPNPSTSSGLGTMARGTRPAGCVLRWPAPFGSADMAGRRSNSRFMLRITSGELLMCHGQLLYQRRCHGLRVHC
jgi:hypothetical protein